MKKFINYSVFHPFTNKTLGFRECAMLKNIADKTNTIIELSLHGKTGSTNSIISLLQLGIKNNSGIVFTIKGENQIECCHLVMDIIKNGWQKESNNLISTSKKNVSINNIVTNSDNIKKDEKEINKDDDEELVSVDDIISLHQNLNSLITNDINNWDLDYSYNIVKYAC